MNKLYINLALRYDAQYTAHTCNWVYLPLSTLHVKYNRIKVKGESLKGYIINSLKGVSVLPCVVELLHIITSDYWRMFSKLCIWRILWLIVS